MMSKFFIEHPVLANVLAVVLVLIGAISVFKLPVAQYPNIVPPTIQVSTRYPGASAQTVIDTIALPIELQVNGVPGMIYMESTSAYDGTYNLTVAYRMRWPSCLRRCRNKACRFAQNPRRSWNS